MEVEIKENEEVGQVVIDNELPKVDGRTAEGKIQVRLQKLEVAQVKILETLIEHGKKIAECCIRR